MGKHTVCGSTFKIMKVYSANSWNDWGQVLSEERIKASSFHTAFNRAAYVTEQRSRKRGSKKMQIKLVYLGTVSRPWGAAKKEGDELIPDDRYLPAEPL